MAERRWMLVGFVVVASSMVLLFSVPRAYFVPMTFFSTACMMLVAYGSGRAPGPIQPRTFSLVIGAGSAILLYLVFQGGAWIVAAVHPFGITSASETAIYSLIASPSNPLSVQVSVLFFDSAGYELYFRGVLQQRLAPRLGLLAVPAVASLDALLHIATMNPLWVGATFVTDTAWGLTYRYGRGTQASFTSHFVWDLAIFVLRPIG